MIKQEPVMTLRKNLGEILNEVEYKRDTIIVTRAGKPSAAIIDMQLFEKIRRMKVRFEKLTSSLQEAFFDKSVKEAEELITEAVCKARSGQ